jgi:hypothetical protein
MEFGKVSSTFCQFMDDISTGSGPKLRPLYPQRTGIMQLTFLTKAVAKAQTSAVRVDWIVWAAIVLGVGVLLLTSVGGVLNGLSLSFLDEVGSNPITAP